MIKKFLIGVTGSAIVSLTLAGSAFATSNPNGTGQPGAPKTTCQQYTTTPGNAADAQSPFNPNGNAGMHYAGNPGTASSENSKSSNAVSQYDVACFQQTSHNH